MEACQNSSPAARRPQCCSSDDVIDGVIMMTSCHAMMRCERGSESESRSERGSESETSGREGEKGEEGGRSRDGMTSHMMSKVKYGRMKL